MGLEIDEQGAVAALLAPQRIVVDSQGARTALSIGIRERMQDPQEPVWADRHARFTRKASAAFATSLQRERL